MSEEYDSEITLGVGRLLMLFFGLVVLCAIFLGIGYTMGRNSVKLESAANLPEGVTAPIATTGTAKPGAAQGGQAKPSDCTAGQDCPASNGSLTFYKAVEQKDSNAKLVPAEETAPVASAPAIAAPEMKGSSVSGFMVQVAAVSRREDAEALTDALRKKQYPVIITNAATDKLFHVQLGPFADAKDAEAMKLRLVNDGYNPIVKK